MFIHLQVSPSYSGGGGSSGSTYQYVIDTNANEIDLWSAVLASNGGNTPSQDNIQVVINEGVDIGAAGKVPAANFAMTVGTEFDAANKSLTILNSGRIIGFGGDGGGYDSNAANIYGGDGGCGIKFESNATLINESTGVIAGGGGGGGGSDDFEIDSDSGYTIYGDGGGGAGIPTGSPGGGYTATQSTLGAHDDFPPTALTGGLAALMQQPAGDGGDAGQNGEDSYSYSGTGGNGGPPYQVASGKTVTFTNNGTIYGNPIT